MLLASSSLIPRVFRPSLRGVRILISSAETVEAFDRKHRGGGGGRRTHDSRRRDGNRGGDRKYAMTRLPPSDMILAEEIPPHRERTPIPIPKDIVAYLNNFVIGQELAKKTLAVGVYQHYKRVEYNESNEERQFLHEVMEDTIKRKGVVADNYSVVQDMKKKKTGFNLSSAMDIVMDKSNIVLLGPSGSGKTYLTMKLAEALNVPIALCDCTTLTQAGYVGEDVESVVQKLLVNANGDIQATEQGIVFLDEFDKIYTSSDPMHTAGNRDVSGKGVQQALLKLVEGTRVLVKNPLQSNQKVEIDTSNILFVASGAFSNLDRIVARRLDQRSLGFSSNSSNLNEALDAKDETVAAEARNLLLAKADHSDMITFGMVPELVGRFPVLVPFHSLDEEMLKQVLTEPRNNIIEQAKQLFLMDNMQLEFTNCAIAEMAQLAVKRRTGARALRSILEKVLLPAKYECPGTMPGSVLISGPVVRGEEPYRKTTHGHGTHSSVIVE